MNVVDRDTAALDIERWLDHKKVSSRKREQRKDEIESLIAEVQDGTLVVDDNCNLVYSLKFSISDEGGSVAVDELKFKPRLRASDLEPYLKGVKATDADGRVRAYVCALTNKPVGIVSKLDTEDKSIAENIALFFL